MTMAAHPVMTIGNCLQGAAQDFDQQGSGSPRLDAELLLAHILDVDRLYLCRNPEEPLSREALSAFRSLAVRRLQGEPVAYLLHRKEFWSLVFEVNERVLIPRPETECLVEEVLNVCPETEIDSLRILDLGTGSGAVGIALARELRRARVVATDISPGALGVARRNARRHGVDHRMFFLAGDLFAPISVKFDIIVSNPPYIPVTSFQALPRGVRDYEPATALLAGTDGTAFHERIISGCSEHLREGGWVVLEIGPDQHVRVDAMLAAAAIFEVHYFRRDYAGLHRVAAAKRKQASWTR